MNRRNDEMSDRVDQKFNAFDKTYVNSRQVMTYYNGYLTNPKNIDIIVLLLITVT